MPSPEPGAGDRPRAAIVLIGAALFLWPTLLNWHPYLFWDTYGYFLQGKVYAQLLLAGAGIGPVPPEAAEGWVGAAGRLLVDDASIRSPTWSLLTYALAAVGSFWLLALANALVAAATVELALLRLFGIPPPRRILVIAGLALLSSLPWFASYLMPDLYAGLLILTGAMLAFAWAELSRPERLALMALYLAAITFHPTHLLLAVGLAALALLLPAAASDRRRRLARLGLPVPVAAAAMLAVGWLGFAEPSLTPHGPPFLLARSWEDGPARDYLATACPESGWAICAEFDRLAPSAQEFLWRPDDAYWNLPPATRAAIRAEEKAIVLQAVMVEPVGQLRASLKNAAVQLGRFGLDDFVLGRGAAVTPEDYTFVYLPQAPAAVWGLGWFTAIIQVATVAALVGVAIWWLRAPPRCAGRSLAWFILAAVALNAVICGVLSGPHPRYQSRVVWLLPLLAVGLLVGSPPVSRTRAAPAPRVP